MAIDGPRWILLPGTLCSGEVFAPMMRALGVGSARQVVVPLDASDVGDYPARLLAVMRPGDVLCGFSLGAIVAAHAADRLPAAGALVLIALNPNPDTPERRPSREGLRAAARSGGLGAALTAAAPALFAQPTADLVAAIVAMAGAEAARIDPQTDLAISRPGALAALRACPAPVVLVTGGADLQAPPPLAQMAAEAAPRAALRIVPGLGHFCLLEDAAAVATAIRDGLNSLGVSEC